MSIAEILARNIPRYVIDTTWRRPVPPHKNAGIALREVPDNELPYYGAIIDIGTSELPKDWERSFFFTQRLDRQDDQIVVLRERYGDGVLEIVNSQYKSGVYLVNKFWQVLGQEARFCDVVVDAPDEYQNFNQQLADLAKNKGAVSMAVAKTKSIRRALEGTVTPIEDLAHDLVMFLDENHKRVLEGLH